MKFLLLALAAAVSMDQAVDPYLTEALSELDSEVGSTAAGAYPVTRKSCEKEYDHNIA